MRKLIAIGEALIDMIPHERGNKLKDVTSFTRVAGGAPANVAGAYAALGGKAQVLTMLGQDAFGDFLVEEMAKRGIDTSLVMRTDDAKTALAFVSLDANGNRDFSFYRNPSSDMLLPKEAVKREWFENCMLHFCSVDLIEAPVKYAHKTAIDFAKESGGLVSFDPNIRFPLWKDRTELKNTIVEFCSYSDIIKVSDEEVEFITGTADLQSGANFFLERGAKLVFVTCGKSGAFAYASKQKAHSAGYPADAVDTTGAGDIFIGTALYVMEKCDMDVDKLTVSDLSFILDVATFAGALSVMEQGAKFDVGNFYAKFSCLKS